MRHDISDKGSLKKYRTEIPNIIFHLGLSPFELALYMHMKRAAGGGSGAHCTKSGRRLADEAGMSHPMMLRAKSTLAQPFDLLKGKPLVVLQQPELGKRQFIEITDVWDENSEYMLSLKSGKPCDHLPAEVVNPVTTPDPEVVNVVTRVVNGVTTSGKPGDRHLKKEPIEERTNKETSSAHAELLSLHAGFIDGPIPDAPAQGKALKWLLENYSAEECRSYYLHLRDEPWRTTLVSWFTVKRGIGEWLARERTQKPVEKSANGQKPKVELDPFGEPFVSRLFTVEMAIADHPDKNPDDIRKHWDDCLGFPWESVRSV